MFQPNTCVLDHSERHYSKRLIQTQLQNLGGINSSKDAMSIAHVLWHFGINRDKLKLWVTQFTW